MENVRFWWKINDFLYNLECFFYILFNKFWYITTIIIKNKLQFQKKNILSFFFIRLYIVSHIFKWIFVFIFWLRRSNIMLNIIRIRPKSHFIKIITKLVLLGLIHSILIHYTILICIIINNNWSIFIIFRIVLLLIFTNHIILSKLLRFLRLFFIIICIYIWNYDSIFLFSWIFPIRLE